MNRFATLAALLVTLPAFADHDGIDEALAKAAPDVLKQMRERQAKNVGVLKFLVQRGDAAPRDAVGELNLGLADRLEAALILAASDKDKVGVIERASLAVAANNNRLANHRTADGRQAFFADKYKLAWGDATVKPDAFLTGTATIAKDLKSVTIQLEAFGEDGETSKVGSPLVVATTRRTLVEAGFSYVLTPKAAPQVYDGSRGSRTNKGAVAKIKAEDETVATSLVLALNDTAKPEGVRFTAEDALRDCPVKLTVLYNGQPQKLDGDRIPEPKEGDVVSYKIENTDTAATHAVVLKVNGKNTLFSEDREAEKCLKWILPPKGSVEVRGFQEDDKTARDFKVLSARESEDGTVRYGDLAGTVRMVVFRGEQVTEDPSAIEKSEPEPRTTMLAAISRGSKGQAKGENRPGSLAALRADLLGRQEALEGTRGIVDKGAKSDAGVQRVHFKPTPTVAVADISVRYYSSK